MQTMERSMLVGGACGVAVGVFLVNTTSLGERTPLGSVGVVLGYGSLGADYGALCYLAEKARRVGNAAIGGFIDAAAQGAVIGGLVQTAVNWYLRG